MSETPELRNTALVDALQTQDLAAVAFALRHGPTVVPLVEPGDTSGLDGAEDVWIYRNARNGERALLLFSDAAYRPDSLPRGVALNSPGWLRTFLALHGDEIAEVFLDIAGPHPMQATPAALLAALET